MIATIFPSSVHGTINVPASKSAMQRACALALLNDGETIIHNPGSSDDDLVAINITRALGAHTYAQNASLHINSNGVIKNSPEINCGESGLACRMFAPIAALTDATISINGSGSLLKRPMYFIKEIFPQLNISVNSANGFLPISLRGPLQPKDISIDGSTSSQYLTGLLFAFAKIATERIIITVNNLKSKPYIDLSLQLLSKFGYEINHDNYERFYISPVKLKKSMIEYHAEGDWSSASILLVAGAIAGSVKLKGLDINSVQADKAIIGVLRNCNAAINTDNNIISVINTNSLCAFEFDATDCPDLFPVLVALAANCKGISIIKGISRLRGKESNRAEAITDTFTKMGVEIILRDDNMIVHGSNIVEAEVLSHHDHRIAMACAVAGLNSSGPIIIQDAGVVNKSYPDFYNHLKLLGATVSLSKE